MSVKGGLGGKLTMHGDDVGFHHRQMVPCCWCCWASLLDDGGGRERRLWIVDGAQIEHRHLPTFALGMTNPQQYFTIPHIIHMDSTGLHWIPLDFTI